MLYGRRVALLMSVLVVGIAGCTKANPLDCSDGTCSDPAHPYCDKDGTVDGAPNTCIKPACSTPNEFVECKGDTAVSCNATEDGYNLMQCPMGCSDAAHGCNMCTPNGTYCTAEGVQSCGSDGAPTTFEACAAGCVADPQPHCAHLVPRYLASVCDTGSTTDFDVTNDVTLGTDLDTACTGGIVTQTAAPDICVVRNKTITIESGATLKATGSRLLALVADDAVTIHGTLDASADANVPGPGGTETPGGSRGGMSQASGGAGFKTAGGAGANATTDGGQANGGAVKPDPAQLAVMVGGPGDDGGGGGGVVLIACRGTASVDGTIDIGGGGGFGGFHSNVGVTVYGAGGGGAGGYLVIQGWAASLTGSFFANGGGGGAGYTGSATGQTGQDGSQLASNGASGGAAQGTGGQGGNGAAKSVGAGNGTHAGGGGGGGLGYLQVYTPSGVTPAITPANSSPDFQPSLTIQTQ